MPTPAALCLPPEKSQEQALTDASNREFSTKIVCFLRKTAGFLHPYTVYLQCLEGLYLSVKTYYEPLNQRFKLSISKNYEPESNRGNRPTVWRFETAAPVTVTNWRLTVGSVRFAQL